MGSANDVYIKILAKDSTAKGIDSAERKLSSFGTQAAKIGGLIAGAFAVKELVRFGKESMNLYNIQAQAEQQLLVALKGREDAQQRLIKQAGKLQQETLFGDEETIQAQALIAAFVKEEEQIKRIIPLVQDLAAAKNMSLAGAADLVSKTLGSSTNAMSRYGIEVNGTVGSVERLESLMRSLNDAFGGQAAAAAKVGTGEVTQMVNEWNDLKEKIGETIVESDSFKDSITKTSQLMYVLGSDSATTLEKWAMSFELIDSRAERMYNTIKRRDDEVSKLRTMSSIELRAELEKQQKAYDLLGIPQTGYRSHTKEGDELLRIKNLIQEIITERQKNINHIDEEDNAYRNGLAEDYYSKLTPAIVNVRERIDEVNAEMTALQKVIENPSTGYEAAIQAYNDAVKLKKELKQLNEILSCSAPREDVPEKMDSKDAPAISAAPAADIFGSEEDMQKAIDQAKEKLRVMYEDLQEEVDALNQQFNMAFVDGLVGGLEAAISGASFGGIMKALLTPIASVLEEQGKILIMSGIGIEIFKKSLSTLSGVAAIATGALLIGAAQGLKALGSAGGGGGGGGGGYVTATASTGSSGYQQTRRGDKQAVDISGKFEIEGDKLVYIIDQANAKNGYTNV